MTAKFIRVGLFFALATLSVLLAFGRGSESRTNRPSPSAYEYKVELVKHKQDLEERLQQDARNGWRVHGFAASPADNELVVILEKSIAP